MSHFGFNLGGSVPNLIPVYKYLAVDFHENLTLGSVVSKMHSNKNIGYKTYSNVYD